MCGINGIVRLGPNAPPIDREEFIHTRDFMALRGPDCASEWTSPTGDIAMGHRRLAIIDLSPTGNQPMSWADKRYWIVFNGEIYNYQELRAELTARGLRLHSTSDTEVIMALYAIEGMNFLQRMRGMYAFALWDQVEKCLLLARDPYGIKPLYYTSDQHFLRFASQVKALEASGAIPDTLEPAGLVGFLLWGSVPEPFTLRRAIRALPAGHYLFVKNGVVTPPHQFYQFGKLNCPKPTNIKSALEDTVRAHLVADVPVGIFLSGGIDSSLIAAIASQVLREPPITLTISFDEFAGTNVDEAPGAAEAARLLKTQHFEKRVRRDDFLDLWPQALKAMDQPTIDGFNTFLVSQVAHEQGLKVVLSGLGGDELFGSYPSFVDVPQWQRWVQIGTQIPIFPWFGERFLTSLRPSQPKLKGILRYGKTLAGAYFVRRGLFLREEIPTLIGADLAAQGLAAYEPIEAMQLILDNLSNNFPIGSKNDPWFTVHLLESGQYMRNQLLRDADWASMAHSLELRVPLVDAWLREQTMKLNFEPARSQGKATLLNLINPQLMQKIGRRPKTGFLLPVSHWLQATENKAQVSQSTKQDSRSLALTVLQNFGIHLH